MVPGHDGLHPAAGRRPLLAKLRERYGEAYTAALIDESEYSGVAGTKTIGVPNLLAAARAQLRARIRHSYHRRPALERFRAAADGSFRLEAISSPSAAVLDYYELAGPRSRSGGWWTLRLARPVRFETLALAGTAVGRRTLVAGGRRAALFRRDGRVVHLRLRVEGG